MGLAVAAFPITAISRDYGDLGDLGDSGTSPPPVIPISKELTSFIPIDPQPSLLQTIGFRHSSPFDPHFCPKKHETQRPPVAVLPMPTNCPAGY